MAEVDQVTPAPGELTAIEREFVAANPRAAALAERARAVSPGGVSQVFRQLAPFPPAYSRAAGARKWTLDDRELVDLCMGHGTLIFGHGHPEITAAIERQLHLGTHFANFAEPEVELAELVCSLIPSAERVRFTGTGSEACSLAVRIARAATGRPAFVKFEGHYHGWHDGLFCALKPPYDRPTTQGILAASREHTIVLPPNDIEALERLFAERDDIAGVIVEPAGGSHGTLPTSREWVEALRRLTREHSALLVFDEMVSGFRLHPGGYQGWTGIEPDLTTLGKAMFGGLPGAALAGRADLMDMMSAGSEVFVGHFGTWNAFPVACAAGARTLRMLADGSVQRAINEYAANLRARLQEIADRAGAAARIYGIGSHCHFLLRDWPFDSDVPPAGGHTQVVNDKDSYRLFRLAMLLCGVDAAHGNNISTAHGDDELSRVCEGFERAVGLMLADGVLSKR